MVILIPAPAAPRHYRNTQLVHLSLDAVTLNFTQFLSDEFTDLLADCVVQYGHAGSIVLATPLIRLKLTMDQQ